MSALFPKHLKRAMLASALAMLAIAAPPAFAPLQAAPAPATPAIPGKHNLTGVWKLQRGTGAFGPRSERGGVTFTVYPYTPQYQAEYDKHIDDEAAGRPVQSAGANCLPSGLGRFFAGGGGNIEIWQNGTQVLARKENNGIHRIWLNRQHLPADDLTPTFYGDSVGHWEGDTLVVDSISLGVGNFLDGRAVYSDKAHIVERLRRVDAETLEVKVTITDPVAFTRPITTTAIHKLLRNYEVQEYYCTNERHRQGAGADQSVVLPGSTSAKDR